MPLAGIRKGKNTLKYIQQGWQHPWAASHKKISWRADVKLSIKNENRKREREGMINNLKWISLLCLVMTDGLTYKVICILDALWYCKSLQQNNISPFVIRADKITLP